MGFGSSLASKLATEMTNFILGKGKYRRQKAELDENSSTNLSLKDRPIADLTIGDIAKLISNNSLILILFILFCVIVFVWVGWKLFQVY